MRRLHVICYTVGIASICFMVVFGLALIWLGAHQFIGQGFLTALVFLFASAATLSIDRAIHK